MVVVAGGVRGGGVRGGGVRGVLSSSMWIMQRCSSVVVVALESVGPSFVWGGRGRR